MSRTLSDDKFNNDSPRLLLPGEDPDEYEGLKQSWLAEYNPGTFSPLTLVILLVEAQWLWMRHRRRCDDFELSLALKSPVDWTDQDHRNLTHFTRYRTTAERSFHRSLANLERHRSTRVRERFSEERLQLRATEIAARKERDARAYQQSIQKSAQQTTKQVDKQAEKEADRAAKQSATAETRAAQQAKKDEEAAAKFIKDRLTTEWTKGRQWVEIHTHEETREFTIEYFPENQTILDEFRHKEKPEMLYRYLHFINGVPEEFAFTMPPDAEYQKEGGLVLHRMEWHTWLKQIALEQETHKGLPSPIQGRTYHRWETWRDNQKDRIAQGLPFRDWNVAEK